MEISRHFKSALNLPSDAPAQVKSTRAAQVSSPKAAVSDEPRLQQLQSNLQNLPEVDLDKVAALKAALANGELSTDVRALAGSMLDYHSGNRG